jgi:hypothetical protein
MEATGISTIDAMGRVVGETKVATRLEPIIAVLKRMAV